MKIIFKKILLGFLIIFFIFFSFLFIGKAKKNENVKWGAVFSQRHATFLGLDWKEVYLALLDDLEFKKIKVITYWDLIETEEGEYSFEDIDWQIAEAKKRDTSLILAIGMKTPRWPECHVPEWAEGLTKGEQKEKVLEMLETIVSRYKDEDIIEGWQIENEPFFKFGECAWEIDKKFLEKEVELVRSIDPNKYIMITDSGEYSFWIKSGKIGDKVGSTLYRNVYFNEIKSYFKVPFPAIYYNRKVKLVNFLLNKEVICTELQAEPWGSTFDIYNLSEEEINKTMNIDKLREIIDFSKKTGMKEFHFWGAEWWYYMKEVKGNNSFWEEIRGVIN